MLNLAQQIAECLARYRLGESENAFHALVELGTDSLPALAERYRHEVDPDTRVFLVKVIRQHRHESAVPFLANALFEADAQIWKESLDGLVSLASPAAIEALKAARCRQFSAGRDQEEFDQWLEEAIEQAEVGVFGDVSEGGAGQARRSARATPWGLFRERKKQAESKTTESPETAKQRDETNEPTVAELRAQADAAPHDLGLRFRLGRALLRSGDAQAAVPELRLATQGAENREGAMALLVEAFDALRMPELAAARRKILEKLAASRNLRRSASDGDREVRQSARWLGGRPR